MKLQTVLPTFFLISELPDEPWKVIDSLSRAIACFEPEEIVPCYDSIGIYFSKPITAAALSSVLETVNLTAEATHFVRHEIPVCYELGLDFPEVCMSLSCSANELIEAHTSGSFRCMAMGFSPGFGYLRPLTDGPLASLWTLPRLSNPRMVVPAGSVAITGQQAAIYPQATPGGWRLIGRTPLKMVDLHKGTFRISTGDEVKFYAVDQGTFTDLWELEHGKPFDFS
jgi:KipI family sensor histidine kinase inhibitor